MKKKEIKGKKFMIIPEAKIVKGTMMEKTVSKDMKRGYKRLYKNIIQYLAYRFGAIDEFDLEEISAIAYCDELDTFDENVGVEVCSAKLELKNHRKLAKLYSRIHKALIKTAIIVDHLCVEHNEKAAAIEDDLVRTYGRMPL